MTQQQPQQKQRQLIRNAIKTPDGTVLVSKHRHDYVNHVDATNGKTYMVDGGLDYQRRSANGDEIDMCLYDNEPHRVQREVLTWGTYGPKGDQPLTYKPIKDMDTDHIEKVYKECTPHSVIKNCLENELMHRQRTDTVLNKLTEEAQNLKLGY